MEEEPWSRAQREVDVHGQTRFGKVIQLREGQFVGDLPYCPHGCTGPIHRHGRYQRYDAVSGETRVLVQRYLCIRCRRTFSVLPGHLFPYRHVHLSRFEAFANRRAGVGQGPDPPPDGPEAAALLRAWDRFAGRIDALRGCFGQLIASGVSNAKDLWSAMRQAKQSLPGILLFLARSHNTSLLADYLCLRPSPL